MLRLSGEPFSFRYVSFQKRMQKATEFFALSRWGEVSVLVDNDRVHLQSAAIVEDLADTLGRFVGRIRRPVEPCGNGYSGMSTFCFHRSLIATGFSSDRKDCCRSAWNRR
jgi:hypothetical protein